MVSIKCVIVVVSSSQANCGFFIMAICIMYRHDKRRLHKSKLQSAKHWLRSCISLVIIMGISWIIGVLAFHQALLAVSYIFTIFIAFQGLFIFILFVPVSKQVSEHLVAIHHVLLKD